MKLLINGEYAEVGIFSFIKCNTLSQLLLVAIFLGSSLAIGILLTIMENFA